VIFSTGSTANASIARTTAEGVHAGVSIGGTTSSTSGQVVHTNGRNGCFVVVVKPSGPTNVTPAFSIAYSSYIPVDHAQVTGNGCSYNGNAIDHIYMVMQTVARPAQPKVSS
jgi:hypothetical protein